MDAKTKAQLRSLAFLSIETGKQIMRLLDELPPSCVDPDAPVEECLVCEAEVRTCEDKHRLGPPEPGDRRCPVHPEGVEVEDGWVCSTKCWDEYTSDPD